MVRATSYEGAGLVLYVSLETKNCVADKKMSKNQVC